VKLSELFGPHPSILLYSFMYGPERDDPCPGCTHTLDGLDGSVRHADRRFPTHVVAKSPIARLEAWARARGWRHLKLLSTAGNAYSHHYFGDTSKFGPEMRAARGYAPGKDFDEPMYNVFKKDPDGTVRHFWGSEILYVPEEPGQHHRAGDLVDPVWGLLDMSPEGRGAFFPKVEYGCGGETQRALRNSQTHIPFGVGERDWSLESLLERIPRLRHRAAAIDRHAGSRRR